MADLPSILVVRADFGRYARAFVAGNYVGIGWFSQTDLSDAVARGKDYVAELYTLYDPNAGTNRKGQNVGQVWRFLEELKLGTYVITPSEERDILHIGKITSDYYFEPQVTDSPYVHRKRVAWEQQSLLRSELSVPLQNTLGSALTIFRVPQVEEVLSKLGVRTQQVAKPTATQNDVRQRVIERLLELSADDFEILIKEILAAIGFETRHTGRVGDGGVDVEGILEMYGFAQVDLRVQVKRYASNTISHHEIKKFRGSVPERSQAAFVTLSDFTKEARAEAIREGYKRIGLINGAQLIDLMVEHYDDLSDEIKTQLRLRYALMPE